MNSEWEVQGAQNGIMRPPPHSGQPGGHNLKFDSPKFKYSNEYYIDWSIFH
jgi:hypothetical protein